MHLPHVRQSAKMETLGCQTPDAQLWQQSELLARLLEPTYDALGDYVADSELIHADETPWPMLKKGTTKWWAWTFSNYDSVYILIDPGRGHQVPLEVLEGSKGLLVGDAHVTALGIGADSLKVGAGLGATKSLHDDFRIRGQLSGSTD